MKAPAEKHSISRRTFLKALGITAGAAAAGYLFLDYEGFLGQQAPIRRWLDSVELSNEASSYGDDGDRVAYAVNYLNLAPDTVSETIKSWNSLSSATKGLLGNSIPTATAAIVADGLTNPATSALARQFPNLLWAHAHSNAVFTFPWLTFVEDGDPRVVKMADLRLSEGNVEVAGQTLGLYYPENEPGLPTDYDKRRFVREGFEFFAGNFGQQLEAMDISDVAVIAEQSIAAAVIIPDSGPYNGVQANSGDTFIFFNTANVPLFAFSAVDNTVAIPDLVQYGSLAVGLNTMRQFRVRHPGLQNSPNLPLSDQGYVQIDNLFIQDPLFAKYLYKGFYEGAFSTNPIERTFSWKEYQSVGLVPERTITGFDVASIGDFHPAYSQPLSLYDADTAIDELLVQSPKMYDPSSWHTGVLFEKI